MTLPFIMFTPPNAKQTALEMREITPEDKAWYKENNIKVSMEEIPTGEIVIYADYGAKTEDDEPDEMLYIVPKGEKCKESMSKLRAKIEAVIGKPMVH